MISHASYAPSSNNSQPWRVVVIENKNKNKKIQELSFNQTQVGKASAVFLILGNLESYDIDSLAIRALKEEIIKETGLKTKKERTETYYKFHPEDRQEEGLRLDVGLFSMNLMHVIKIIWVRLCSHAWSRF